MNLPQGDVALPNGPTDGISSIAFQKKANSQPQQNELVACGSWDRCAYCWTVTLNNQGNVTNSQMAGKVQVAGPVLSVSFACPGFPNANTLYLACADGNVYAWVLGSPQAQPLGRHSAPVKCVRTAVVGGRPLVISASWDKTVKFWNPSAPGNPVCSAQLSERAYTMDVAQSLLVVGTADKKFHAFNLGSNTPQNIVESRNTKLQYQSRSVACFPDGTGYCAGSIEGRVHCARMLQQFKSKEFSFKCHRNEQLRQIYPVNALAFNHVGTFATAGADGIVSFWDHNNKKNLKNFPSVGQSITDCAFNSSSNLLAYAVSYDWHRGATGSNPSSPNAVVLKTVRSNDIQPRR